MGQGTAKRCREIRAYTQSLSQKGKNAANQKERYWADPERSKSRTKAWRSANREHVTLYDKVTNAARRARQYGSQGMFTIDELRDKLKAYGGICHWCRLSTDGKPQIDHIIPLSKGGYNDITNVVPVCKSCNLKKKDRLPRDWDSRIALF